MFNDARAYSNFSQLIRREDRFGQSPEAKAFVEEFCSQLGSAAFVIPKGQVFFRAANDYVEVEDETGGIRDIQACGASRMLPQWRFALEGRVNPSGLVVLYMATTAETAISEIRPWVGDIVSVVHIEVMKGRRVVELSKLHSEHQRLSWKGLMARMPNAEMAPEEVNEIVWSDIEYAFSRPVTRSETGGEYAPTQILAGAVRVAGFDGVAYKSLFGGDNGYNVAFFGTKEVRLLSGHLYQVKDIEIKAEESGGAWVRAQESLHSGHT